MADIAARVYALLRDVELAFLAPQAQHESRLLAARTFLASNGLQIDGPLPVRVETYKVLCSLAAQSVRYLGGRVAYASPGGVARIIALMEHVRSHCSLDVELFERLHLASLGGRIISTTWEPNIEPWHLGLLPPGNGIYRVAKHEFLFFTDTPQVTPQLVVPAEMVAFQMRLTHFRRFIDYDRGHRVFVVSEPGSFRVDGMELYPQQTYTGPCTLSLAHTAGAIVCATVVSFPNVRLSSHGQAIIEGPALDSINYVFGVHRSPIQEVNDMSAAFSVPPHGLANFYNTPDQLIARAGFAQRLASLGDVMLS